MKLHVTDYGHLLSILYRLKIHCCCVCVKFCIDHIVNTGLAEEYEQIENFGPNFSQGFLVKNIKLSNNCCEKYQSKI